MRPPARIALAAAVAAWTAGAVVALGVEGGPGISDISVYARYGERIAAGDVPYRDFRVEYPPGALVPFVLPSLVSDGYRSYVAVFAALMTVALAATAALVALALDALGAGRGRAGAAVGVLVGGFVLLGPFLLTRFDLFAAAVTAAALAALLHRRDRLGPVLLGLAIATKIYPLVLLPLVGARACKERGKVEAARQVGLAVAAALVVYLPFLVVAPEGVARSVWQQLGRPLQIESLGAAVLLALHHAFGMGLAWASGHGSQNLTGAVAGAASALSTAALVAALLLVWLRFARGDVGPERFARHAAAAVVGFVAFSKVLSPQFLVWLLPLVALVDDRRRRLAASSLVLAACLLTRLWFPSDYWALVKEFDPSSSSLVLVRDLVLVALFVVLVRARERAAAGSPPPFP